MFNSFGAPNSFENLELLDFLKLSFELTTKSPLFNKLVKRHSKK